MRFVRFIVAALAALALHLPAAAAADKVLRVTPHSNLAILDPIWTTQYMVRNHGYMIYDTLFGTDEKNAVQPQMVESWDTSADRKTWTFKLRDGLAFHDGKPVQGEDATASLARWGKRDAMGQKLMTFVDRFEAVDAKTFRIVLKEPCGFLLEALGKPSSNVPFIMPRRVAETPADKQIDDYTGSGPFVFKKDEWKPGALVVYVKNANYKPRAEPPSGSAGGKRVYVDRVEWRIISDAQTQVNALLAGEIDVLEQPAFESYAQLKDKPDIEIVTPGARRLQYMLRFNHLQPPFNDVKVRQAAQAALAQEPFLRAQVGVKDYYRPCAAMFGCETPYAAESGSEAQVKSNLRRAQELLKASGYDGTPIVIMKPTDLAAIAKLPDVAAQLLRQAGFKVDLQAMDWNTLVSRRAKKDPPAQGGWNVFVTSFVVADISNPLNNAAASGLCDKGWFGWSCDEKLETLRHDFAREADTGRKKALAAAVQARAFEIVTHAPLGEYINPPAVRKGIKGLIGSGQYYWNISKD